MIPAAVVAALLSVQPALAPSPTYSFAVGLAPGCYEARIDGVRIARRVVSSVLAFSSSGAGTITVGPCRSAPTQVSGR